MAIGKVLLSCR